MATPTSSTQTVTWHVSPSFSFSLVAIIFNCRNLKRRSSHSPNFEGLEEYHLLSFSIVCTKDLHPKQVRMMTFVHEYLSEADCSYIEALQIEPQIF